MNTWQPADFKSGDTVHIDLGRGITRRYAVMAARSRVLEIRDPKTGITEERTYDQIASHTHNGITHFVPPRTGGYLETLSESQEAGTTWTCRCGCPNPGIWDCCQECQHPGNV